MTLTVNQVVASVRSRLDEVTTATWTDTEIKRWTNEALRDLARRTKHLRDTTTVTTTAGQAEYTVPANVIEIDLVYYAPGDGRQIPLMHQAFQGMNALWGQNMDRSGGDPQVWTQWGTPPLLKLRLYPTPPASSKTVTLYVVRLPASITEDDASNTTALDFPLAWVDLVKDYAEYCALRKDRDQRWKESFDLYNSRVDDMLQVSDYTNQPMEMIADPMVSAGVVPRWLADPNWGAW